MTDRKQGQVIPKGDGKYLVRVYRGRDANGKRKYASAQVKGTIYQANLKLAQLLKEVETGTFVEPSRETLKEYGEKWLGAKVDISPRTLWQYRYNLEHYVYPTLGTTRLDRLQAHQIQACYAGLRQQGLSSRTIRYAHAVLRQALGNAVEWGFLLRNPADLVKLPKAERQEMSVLTPEQVQTFLQKTEGDALYPLWCLCLLSGVRPQEALAARFSDIHEGTLHIQRAMTLAGDNKTWIVAETKTEKSRRGILLPQKALDAMALHKKRRTQQEWDAKRVAHTTMYLFASPETGEPLEISGVRRAWKRALKKAELPTVRLYDMRHTHATLLLAAGEHPKVVGERLGHSSTTLTMDTYSHVLPSMQKQAVESLERVLKIG